MDLENEEPIYGKMKLIKKKKHITVKAGTYCFYPFHQFWLYCKDVVKGHWQSLFEETGQYCYHVYIFIVFGSIFLFMLLEFTRFLHNWITGFDFITGYRWQGIF